MKLRVTVRSEKTVTVRGEPVEPQPPCYYWPQTNSGRTVSCDCFGVTIY